MIILDSTADEAKTAERVGRVSAIITDGGGEVTEVQKWGRRKLAYEIKRRRDGVYVLLRFTAPATVLKELERRLKLDELVLRHVTALAVESRARVAAASAPAAAAADGAAASAPAAATADGAVAPAVTVPDAGAPGQETIAAADSASTPESAGASEAAAAPPSTV